MDGKDLSEKKGKVSKKKKGKGKGGRNTAACWMLSHLATCAEILANKVKERGGKGGICGGKKGRGDLRTREGRGKKAERKKKRERSLPRNSRKKNSREGGRRKKKGPCR